MTDSCHIIRRIKASVQEVLPSTGLAYVLDDDSRTWGITRSTPGTGLAALQPGQQVELTVVCHPDFDLVSGYAALT